MKTSKIKLLALALTLALVCAALAPAVWAGASTPEVRSTSALSGKRILFLGDSLMTAYGISDQSLSWNGLLETRSGMIATNIAIAGSTMCTGSDRDFSWSAGRSFSPISTRELPEGSFDVVLIDGGANDWNNALPMGSDPNSRDSSNFMGAVNVLLDRVQKAYPDALILYMTVWENYDSPNAQGKTGDDFSQAAAEVCARRGVPCFAAHLPEVSGINAQDSEFRQKYFCSSTDRWHLNEKGHALFYPVIADWLEQQLLEHYLTDGFYDVPEYTWYAEAVSGIYERGLMMGTDETHFSPNDKTSRAMLVTVLYRAAGSPDVRDLDCPFGDVSPDSYYYDAVTWGFHQGIVQGVTADAFDPTAPLPRQQLITFLYRYAQASASGDFEPMEAYTDWEEVSEFAREPMAWAVGEGILSGTTDSTLSPNGIATRAQMAAVLLRYLEAS